MTPTRWTVEASRSIAYSVVMTRSLLDPQNPLLQQTALLEPSDDPRVVVSDASVWQRFGESFLAYFQSTGIAIRVVTLRVDETKKTFREVLTLVDAFEEARVMRRRTPIIAVGGGTVLDIAGLAAALYGRGIPYIRIPTTLVGMIDAAVGIKTAVDHRGRKSLIGSYHAPAAALVDTSFLSTLPDRAFADGLAEALKIALVADASLFRDLENNAGALGSTKKNSQIVNAIVPRAIDAMVTQLRGNLWEESLERLPDLGHSFSPGIEMAALGRITHGQAVALDIALTVAIAARRRTLDEQDGARILALIEALGLPIHDPVMSPDLMWSTLCKTTVHRDGQQRVPLLTGLGEAVFVNDITLHELEGALAMLDDRATDR